MTYLERDFYLHSEQIPSLIYYVRYLKTLVLTIWKHLIMENLWTTIFRKYWTNEDKFELNFLTKCQILPDKTRSLCVRHSLEYRNNNYVFFSSHFFNCIIFFTYNYSPFLLLVHQIALYKDIIILLFFETQKATFELFCPSKFLL